MLDELIGSDSNATAQDAPAQAALAAGLLVQANRFKDRPVRLQSFIAGLAHQGLLTRPAVASALAPFLRMPPPEPRTHKRARMAKVICDSVAAKECVTREDLEAAGFTSDEITSLYREALRVSGVEKMAA